MSNSLLELKTHNLIENNNLLVSLVFLALILPLTWWINTSLVFWQPIKFVYNKYSISCRIFYRQTGIQLDLRRCKVTLAYQWINIRLKSHKLFRSQCVFVDSTNQKLFYTSDNGQTIHRSDLIFHPSELAFDEELPDKFVILDKVDTNRKVSTIVFRVCECYLELTYVRANLFSKLRMKSWIN